MSNTTVCVSKHLLPVLGMSRDQVRRLEGGGGLHFSDVASFGGGGGGGHDVTALERAPQPRVLVLVGMTDRYGEGLRRTADVRTYCVADDGLERAPTAREARDLVGIIAALGADGTAPGPSAEALIDALGKYL